MKHRTHHLAPALVCALTLGLAACGGGDGASKEDFVADADAICADAGDRVEALGEPTTPEEIAETMPQIADVFGGMLDKLEELEAPDDVNGDFKALIAEGRKLQTAAQQLGQAAAAGDPEQITAVAGDLESAGTAAAKLGKQIGLARCGTTA